MSQLSIRRAAQRVLGEVARGIGIGFVLFLLLVLALGLIVETIDNSTHPNDSNFDYENQQLLRNASVSSQPTAFQWNVPEEAIPRKLSEPIKAALVLAISDVVKDGFVLVVSNGKAVNDWAVLEVAIEPTTPTEAWSEHTNFLFAHQVYGTGWVIDGPWNSPAIYCRAIDNAPSVLMEASAKISLSSYYGCE